MSFCNFKWIFGFLYEALFSFRSPLAESLWLKGQYFVLKWTYLALWMDRKWLLRFQNQCFEKIFLILTENKVIFMICKSVKTMTGPSLVLLKPKRTELAVLCSNNWLHDFNATRFQKKIRYFPITSFSWNLISILMLIATISLEKTFNGSEIKF